MVKMNPDLAMGDELLKKTGAGNLFMVFGEPDVEITKQKDGKIVVEIKGVDVYDPTTGQIRCDSTDDIACWFIDTDYNGTCAVSGKSRLIRRSVCGAVLRRLRQQITVAPTLDDLLCDERHPGDPDSAQRRILTSQMLRPVKAAS